MAFDERHALEALLDALVHVAEALLEPQHLFADDRKAEVPRLDDAGVDRTHRDLVHAVTADRDEWIALPLALERTAAVALPPHWGKSARPRAMAPAPPRTPRGPRAPVPMGKSPPATRHGAATASSPARRAQPRRAGRRQRAACG